MEKLAIVVGYNLNDIKLAQTLLNRHPVLPKVKLDPESLRHKYVEREPAIINMSELMAKQPEASLDMLIAMLSLISAYDVEQAHHKKDK